MRRIVRVLAMVMLFVAMVAGLASAAAVAPLGDARLGAWMPQYLDGFDPSRHHRATIVSRARADAFVYRGRVVDSFGAGGPFARERAIVPARSGYEKAGVAYDDAHGIAFTSGTCCGIRDTVLAFAGPPPRRVVDVDLRRVHTVRGIALGDSVAKVLRIDGFAKLQSVPGHCTLRLLAYAAMYGPKSPSCGQFQNFVSRDGRLVYVELLDGC